MFEKWSDVEVSIFKMDILSIFLFGLISAAVGGIVMLLFQFYIFTKLSDLPQEALDQKFVNDKYFLPDVSFTVSDWKYAMWENLFKF